MPEDIHVRADGRREFRIEIGQFAEARVWAKDHREAVLTAASELLRAAEAIRKRELFLLVSDLSEENDPIHPFPSRHGFMCGDGVANLC